NPVTQKFFDDMVTEELEHKARLQLEAIKEGIVAKTVGVLPETPLESPIVDLDKVRSGMDYTEALAVAIEKEKRSFRLYACLSGQVEEKQLRETLLSLAEEEVKHLMKLESLYKQAATEQR
ncbi:MAG: ferritin-like domain-containing protein, partial [Planctomycetota bacterium]